MSSPTSMADRHRAQLTELAELGMALARDVQGRALAAPGEEVPDMALAFQRVTRSVRQTLALEARLEREAAAAGREAASAARRETLARVQSKRGEIRRALHPLIWTEAEGDEDEFEALVEALDARLMESDLICEEFAQAPIDACIARIRADLGLAAANTDMAPDAAGDPDDGDRDLHPEVVPHESST